ncbi:MAG: sulfatase-like hydrolase/transferase, partial [Planctomycetota bacterium]
MPCSGCESDLAGGPGAAEQPNIIFILADDLGYGDLGCYGQEKIETPNLDRMAAEGMRFTQHYAGSTVCAPSRCA